MTNTGTYILTVRANGLEPTDDLIMKTASNSLLVDSSAPVFHAGVPKRMRRQEGFLLPMKSPAEYEQEISDLKRMIEKLKAQTVKALEAYVGEMRKVEELSK